MGFQRWLDEWANSVLAWGHAAFRAKASVRNLKAAHRSDPHYSDPALSEARAHCLIDSRALAQAAGSEFDLNAR